MPTKIGWAEETVNPITGCSKKSAGCLNCYAERIALQHGFSKFPWVAKYAQDNIKFHPERLKRLYEWKTRKMIFEGSMTDLFHELVQDEWLEQIFKANRDNPQHIIQILTKRPERAVLWPFPAHVWIGTSIEDARVLHRLETLKQAQAAVRFISFEPLIGPVGKIDLTGIHWVIVGGESGPQFRKMDHAWAREIRDQCVEQGVPFFFKQDSGVRSELRPYLLEVDKPPTEWKQYPALDGSTVVKKDVGGKQLGLF